MRRWRMLNLWFTRRIQTQTMMHRLWSRKLTLAFFQKRGWGSPELKHLSIELRFCSVRCEVDWTVGIGKKALLRSWLSNQPSFLI